MELHGRAIRHGRTDLSFLPFPLGYEERSFKRGRDGAGLRMGEGRLFQMRVRKAAFLFGTALSPALISDRAIPCWTAKGAGTSNIGEDGIHRGMGQDDLDEVILRLLQANGKMSIEEIAERVGRSPSTVRDRVRRMEEERVILGYSTIVDEDRLNIEAEALVLADIEPEAEGRAMGALMALEAVSEVMKVTGEPRIMFRIRASDRHELLRYLDRYIRPLGFRRMDVRLVLDHTVRYPGTV